MKKALILMTVLSTTVLSCSNYNNEISEIKTSIKTVKSKGSRFTFDTGNLIDNNAETSSQLRSSRNAIGEWVEFRFKKPINISSIDLKNGFQLIDKEYGDLYFLNSRIKKLKLCVNNAHCKIFNLEDTKDTLKLSLPVSKDIMNVKIYIMDAYTGKRWPKDLAISEVSFTKFSWAYFIIGLLLLSTLALIVYKRQLLHFNIFKIYLPRLKNILFKTVPAQINQINKKDTYQMGIDFEHFTAKIFEKQKQHFTIESWTYDIHTKVKDVHVEADKNPDLIVRYDKTGHRFAVECKYRSHVMYSATKKARVIRWGDATDGKFKRYKKYAKDKKIPIFIMIGLEGEPKNPKYTFCVPLKDISDSEYPEIPMYKLKKYVRLPGDSGFFWKHGKLT